MNLNYAGYIKAANESSAKLKAEGAGLIMVYDKNEVSDLHRISME